MGGPPMAAVRAVSILAAGAASAEGLVLDVLLAPVRVGAGVRATHPTATAHDAAAIAASCALVAVRHRAATGGARAHRPPLDFRGGQRPVTGSSGLLPPARASHPPVLHRTPVVIMCNSSDAILTLYQVQDSLWTVFCFVLLWNRAKR